MTPYLRVEKTGVVFELTAPVSTVGRGPGVDLCLDDLSVSRLHAELIRRGPFVYVADIGLSANGTRVNGRPVTRRVLADGDVVSFGSARLRAGGLADLPGDDARGDDRRSGQPELTRREMQVLEALCRPALLHQPFVTPTTAADIAGELVVTEAAVKQHLLRLYAKFHIDEGVNRRARLANEVISSGIVRPLPLPLTDAARRAG